MVFHTENITVNILYAQNTKGPSFEGGQERGGGTILQSSVKVTRKINQTAIPTLTTTESSGQTSRLLGYR